MDNNNVGGSSTSSTERAVGQLFESNGSDTESPLSTQEMEEQDSILNVPEKISELRVAARDSTPRWGPSEAKIFLVQCAKCLKWRKTPTIKEYEEIRKHHSEMPWVCEMALKWGPNANCNIPTDWSQNDPGLLWAMDEPNLPSSPPGWRRKIIARSDCSLRFADVYYITPDGKSLRSMREVAKYIDENPGSVPALTNLNHFSFVKPRPMPGVWTAKNSKTRSSFGKTSK